MREYKTLLVERPINCPLCKHNLSIGDMMYKDDGRGGEVLCGYCREDYEEEIIREEAD